jgi:thymidylate synthase ThyX
MSAERQVYLLDPQEFPPETIAVAFAKTSRSPHSFRQIAAELNEEKSAEFHEKWVVGYGHASVAEHAVLHIAVENVSRLAVETLESNRLASYTEKSTRYQKWGPEDFYLPRELEDHLLGGLFVETCRTLFSTYHQILPAVKEVIARQNPRREGESEAAFDRRVRSDYVDVCRFLLPAASLANVGITVNARTLEHALRKMFSHPLEEVRQMGEEMKTVAAERLPTLIKYVQPVPYWQAAAHRLSGLTASLERDATRAEDWCRLVDFDPRGEERVLAAALYRYGSLSFAQALERVNTAGEQGRQELAELLFAGRGKHDMPLRELEYAGYTFDLILDQGGYFELKRHRMMTQTPQPLSTLLGYALPRAIVEAGVEQPYRLAMQAADHAYRTLVEFNPDVASYVVPNGYNRRVLLSLNLRSAMHLLGLRSAANAHFSIRRVSQRMAEELRSVSPILGRYLPVNEEESWRGIEEQYFVGTAE